MLKKINKKKKSPSQNPTRDAISRSVGVIVEDLDRKLDLVLEQHTNTDKKIDNLDKRLTGVEGRLTGVEGRLTGVEGRLTGVEEQVANLTVNMTIVKQQMQIINAGFKRKVELEEFEALESRVAALEKQR